MEELKEVYSNYLNLTQILFFAFYYNYFINCFHVSFPLSMQTPSYNSMHFQVSDDSP